MLDILKHKKIPVLADVDVLVVGAGSAGCCAALGARAFGDASVMLVERYGFAGGASTQVLDTFYGFYTPGEAPKKVVGGLPDRVVDALAGHGAMYLRANTYGAGTGVTYNPERLKGVWDDLLKAADVRVLFHAMLVDAEVGNGGEAERITSAVFYTKGGFVRVRAKRYVDASGDADLCARAGIPFEKAGESEPAQTLTTTFRISNVDLDAYAAAGGKQMLVEKMERAVGDGVYDLPRAAGSVHRMAQRNCVSTVAVRVSETDLTDSESLTRAEQEGRRQAFAYERFFRERVPGYEAADLIGLSTQIGIRESRRVYGNYRLTRDDCMSARRFDDVVLLCGAPIEDHRSAGEGEAETAWAYVPDGKAYDVPYRTLVPKGRDELWAAGRCFSATHDAHASCRSMGQTMSMGQAAGVAAALSIEKDCGAGGVPIDALQARLLDLGAVLETPEEVAETAAKAWKR